MGTNSEYQTDQPMKTLSDKIDEKGQLWMLDVKEFIKDILKDCCTLCEDDIKKRAGPKLT